ncbi:MAG TPA: VCBS repeat-containing protein, partial [Nitrospiria bacterium]|nr:VCBS repeat-containing protein [Nitrospiria bacterium]
GTTDGTFVAFNLPGEQVHLSAVALEETPITGGFIYYAGTQQATIFPGGVTNQNVTLNPAPLGQIGFYSPFFGQVTLPDKVTPVSFAQAYALGTTASLATADPAGQFSYSAVQALFLNQSQYTIRTTASPGYVPTYQSNVSVDGSFHSLILFPASQVNGYISAAGLSGNMDPAKGILTGNIIDNGSLRATAGITLAATDLTGNPVGDIRYFDTHGLPTLNSGSSKNGGYMIFNLPPGLIQVRAVSPDDSGNGLAEVYSGGITLADIHVNNSPPSTVQVSGATQDLSAGHANVPVAAANLSILGEKTVFSSSNGLFSQPLSPYSTFLVKAHAKNIANAIDTYNIFGTIGVDSPQTVFVATSTDTLSAIAASAIAAGDATLSLPDLVNNGVIGGKVATYGFSPAFPVQGFSATPLPAGSWSQQRMVAGLFDADNELDLAIVNELDNTLTILLGNGDGTFHPAVGSPLCLPLGTPMLPGQTCLTGAGPVAVRETDLDGDGVIDLIVVNKGLNSVTVLRGTGAGNFTLVRQICKTDPSGYCPTLQLQSGSQPVGVSVADFNNDLLTDLAVVNSGSNSFTLIPGSGTFQFDMSQAKSFNTLGTSPVAVVSRDFNGDGNTDIAILNQGSGGSVSVFLGLGNGYFSPAAGSPYKSPDIGSQPVAMAAADINGDGYFDLAVANSGSASVAILLGKPGGIFAPASGSPVLLSSSPQYILLTDVNLDNRLDLVTANANGTISVLNGLGDGTFTPETVYNAGGPGVNLASLELFDFTDDLLSDMVAFQGGTGNLLFLPGAMVPLSGVTLASTNMSGATEGNIRYLDQNSNIIIGASATDVSGRFLIFDVPPGTHDIFAKAGAAGNQWIKSYAGSATFGNIQMVPPQRKSILYSGLTGNLAGDQVVRNVTGVTISVYGTGTTFLSSLLDSTFSFTADANHQLFIQLHR